MEPTPAFERRVKRHVIGPHQRFFAVAAPGLESHLFREIASGNLSANRIEATEGGVLFDGRLSSCYQANLQLRLTTRVWMRVADFSATNFRQLRHKVADIPWELHLFSDTLPKVLVRTTRSRLYHSDAVSQRVATEIQDRIAARGVPAGRSAVQKVLARIRKDRITLSLDTSGDPLYKRGLKTHRVVAPLRETHAALALILLGYNGRAPLLDPMSGAGTFSIEGAMMAQNIPAGWFRTFQFMHWPAFRPGQWAYLKRESEKKIRKSDRPAIFASDIDPTACNALHDCVTRHGLNHIVAVQQIDFFHILPETITPAKGWVVLNPPYGRRLSCGGGTGNSYAEVAKKLAADFKGWRLALVLPDKQLLSQVPFRLRTRTMFHGGLKACLAYGTIP